VRCSTGDARNDDEAARPQANYSLFIIHSSLKSGLFFGSFCRRKKNQKRLGDFNALRLRLRLNGKSPKKRAPHSVYALRAPECRVARGHEQLNVGRRPFISIENAPILNCWP
jgi:hypothetical protein